MRNMRESKDNGSNECYNTKQEVETFYYVVRDEYTQPLFLIFEIPNNVTYLRQSRSVWSSS